MCTPKPSEHRPGYPRDGLPIIKHRQLARQVGAFGDFVIESSTDLDDMIFSAGITFIFGSWIYKVDDNAKLQSCLMEIPAPQASPNVSTTMLDQLAEKFSHLSISDSTRTQEVTINHDSRSDMSPLFGLEIQSEVQHEDPVRFPL